MWLRTVFICAHFSKTNFVCAQCSFSRRNKHHLRTVLVLRTTEPNSSGELIEIFYAKFKVDKMGKSRKT